MLLLAWPIIGIIITLCYCFYELDEEDVETADLNALIGFFLLLFLSSLAGPLILILFLILLAEDGVLDDLAKYLVGLVLKFKRLFIK